MNWHFLLLCAAVTLTSVCSQFNFPLEELGSDVGIQVFNQIVKARPQENIVVSPHGIASVLGVLQLGADGKTKKQLTTVMRYSLNGQFLSLIAQVFSIVVIRIFFLVLKFETFYGKNFCIMLACMTNQS